MVNREALIQHFDRVAPHRSAWFRRNFLYHEHILRSCRPFLNPDSRVLELGCSTGDLLTMMEPAYGVGVDISPASIAVAQRQYPASNLHWLCADAEMLPDEPLLKGPFDVVVIVDLLGYLTDIENMLRNLHRLTHSRSRVVISLWNWMWRPILRVAEAASLKAPDLEVRQNWLSPQMVRNLLELADFEIVQTLPGMLLPASIPGISSAINSLTDVAGIRRLALFTTLIARPASRPEPLHAPGITVVIPTRNEVGNIEAGIRRMPIMGSHTEVLFVDGNSTDGTVEKIHEQMSAYPERDIKYMPQVPPSSPDAASPPDLMLKLGKGDAVRKGFAAARGDIVMILDADLTVPPEDLPKFYDALVNGKARFANGTRFVYPQQEDAMPLLNRLGNVIFSLLFSWLLDQPITDTLCGTKALYKRDYEEIAANRSYFGDFDPFGDFDLLFGAARLKHRILEVPIHYHARTYGESKVRVSLHGPLLGRMSLLALWHFKIRPFLRGASMLNMPSDREPEAVPVSVPKPRSSVLFALLALLGVAAVWVLIRRR